MPSFAIALTERMAWQTAAYVRSLGRTRARGRAGRRRSAARALYESTGCASCHVVGGRGGVLGPELTSIGALRGAPYLRDALVKPAAAHPPGYLVVRAVTDGRPGVRGIRVNEDVFWIHIRDARRHGARAGEVGRCRALDRELDGDADAVVRVAAVRRASSTIWSRIWRRCEVRNESASCAALKGCALRRRRRSCGSSPSLVAPLARRRTASG